MPFPLLGRHSGPHRPGRQVLYHLVIEGVVTKPEGFHPFGQHHPMDHAGGTLAQDRPHAGDIHIETRATGDQVGQLINRERASCCHDRAQQMFAHRTFPCRPQSVQFFQRLASAHARSRRSSE